MPIYSMTHNVLRLAAGAAFEDRNFLWRAYAIIYKPEKARHAQTQPWLQGAVMGSYIPSI
jgi:hypothetical protein